MQMKNYGCGKQIGNYRMWNEICAMQIGNWLQNTNRKLQITNRKKECKLTKMCNANQNHTEYI